MTTPLPKWLMQRYAVLWKAFSQTEFSHDDTAYTLQEDKIQLISVIISSLKKHGWLMMYATIH